MTANEERLYVLSKRRNSIEIGTISFVFTQGQKGTQGLRGMRGDDGSKARILKKKTSCLFTSRSFSRDHLALKELPDQSVQKEKP